MRAVVIAVLASAFGCAVSMPSFAQNLNEILNQLQGIAQPEMAKRAESEWSRLPKTERACVNQKLGERGDSVQSLTRRGVLPSDSRVTDLRSQCRVSPAPAATQNQPSAQTNPSPLSGDSSAAVPSTPESAQREPQSEQPQSEATHEKLKTDLAKSVERLGQLEKRNADLERAIRKSERMRLHAEDAKAEIEEAQLAAKGKSDARVARIQADEADAIAQGRVWEIVAYVAIGGLILLLIANASVLLIRRKGASAGTQQGIKSETTPLKSVTQTQGT